MVDSKSLPVFHIEVPQKKVKVYQTPSIYAFLSPPPTLDILVPPPISSVNPKEISSYLHQQRTYQFCPQSILTALPGLRRESALEQDGRWTEKIFIEGKCFSTSSRSSFFSSIVSFDQAGAHNFGRVDINQVNQVNMAREPSYCNENLLEPFNASGFPDGRRPPAFPDRLPVRPL